MPDNIHFVAEIYKKACELKLCSTKYEFSENFAGRDKRWLSTLLSQNNSPSELTLLSISQNFMNKARSTRRREVINTAKGINIRISKVLSDRLLVAEHINEGV